MGMLEQAFGNQNIVPLKNMSNFLNSNDTGGISAPRV